MILFKLIGRPFKKALAQDVSAATFPLMLTRSSADQSCVECAKELVHWPVFAGHFGCGKVERVGADQIVIIWSDGKHSGTERSLVLIEKKRISRIVSSFMSVLPLLDVQ